MWSMYYKWASLLHVEERAYICTLKEIHLSIFAKRHDIHQPHVWVLDPYNFRMRSQAA